MRRLLMLCLLPALLLLQKIVSAQPAAQKWADSVLQTLSPNERIAQLMVIRTSTTSPNGPILFDAQADSLVKLYNIGAVCVFQGTPEQHATMLNRIQGMAKTPIMVTVDAEWGLGMRFTNVQNFPYQLTLGALSDAQSVYKVGKAIADQCRRMNIHVNYAPSVDINNNPANPVIGVRSFGEDKYKVALFGTRIMEGMQDNGVMACAKHFPGHGDVSVDSHFDLPVINKNIQQLTDLELYPFQAIFKKGVGSVMVAHLAIPAIDSTPNKPTSISYNNITTLMRNEMGYKGLTFTDALEMKGVAKFYPGGEAAVQSIIAGNDMLCLPADVPATIAKINEAIAQGRLTTADIDAKCRRVLEAKYDYVVGRTGNISTSNLLADLNKDIPALRKEVAEQALTVIKMQDGFFPLSEYVKQDVPAAMLPAEPAPVSGKKKKKAKTSAAEIAPVVNTPSGNGIVYIAVGSDGNNELAGRLKAALKADVIGLPFTGDALKDFDPEKLKQYQRVIIGLHGVARNPAKNFGIPAKALDVINTIQAGDAKAVLLTFGNPYVNQNFQQSNNLVACYEDDAVFQGVAADWLLGKFNATGTLPVTVGNFKFGSGIVKKKLFEIATPEAVGMRGQVLQAIDSIASEAIAAKATPGCVVTVLRHGKMVFQKPYGFFQADSVMPVTTSTLYDMASVTKISATTVSVMKLYEQGKLDIHQTIGHYLPWLNGSGKEKLLVENLLLHQAGLNAYIPFFREVSDKAGNPNPAVFAGYKHNNFDIAVTNDLYMRHDWRDSMFARIKSSALVTNELKYVYSDNDFILLGKIVEAVAGMPLEQYVQQTFYDPLGMTSTGFKPYEHFANNTIAPTEDEKIFRKGLVWGYVHDPGAAMFGNVAGHAGLFSNATDLAKLYQMLLNGGTYDGQQYLKKETIDFFTAYQTPISRRGLGFDKPEKDNDLREADKAYPAKAVSLQTFGHTGFTGIGVWVDPKYDLIYMFFSNRVNPDGSNKLLQMNVRSRIQDVVYKAIVE